MTTLAICIPTYRRPEQLQHCIESALASAEGRPISVEVVDDSADDTNLSTLAALCARHSQIHWHRNPQNLGIDRNIQRCVDVARTDYAWLVGEDDRFLPGAVARLHDRLQSADRPPFLFANYCYADADHAHILGQALADLPAVDQTAAPFIRSSLWATGFIGGCIVDRQAWSSTDPGPYLGTYFTHVGRIVEIIAASGTVSVEARPCVANRAQGEDTFTWKRDSFGVFLGFERMCQVATTRVPAFAEALEGAIDAYRKRMAYLSVKTTFRLRSEGAFDMRQWQAHIATLRISRRKKAWLFALAAVPSAALRPLAQAYIWWHARRTRARRSPTKV